MKKIIPLIILGVALFASCTHDKGEYDRDDAARLRLNFTVNNMGSEIKTRATVMATGEEETVNTLHLFFFEHSSDRSGRLVKCVSLDSDLEMDVERKLSDSDITVSDAYNVIAIANIDSGLYISGTVNQWIDQWSDATEKFFAENVMGSITFADRIKSNWIPMSGSTTKAAGDNKINLSLTRVVSRMDVVNTVTNYRLESASVWNAYYRSSLTGEAVLDYGQTVGLRTQKFYGEYNISGNSVSSKLYAFENQVLTPENGDRHTTCIIVELEDEVTGSRHFYRINIHPDGSPQNLKRNNSYTITINGVAGPGYDTEEDAYSGKSNELLYTINYWDLDDNGLIVTDINSILAIPTKTIRIGQKGAVNSYTITTFSRLENPNPLMIKSQIYQPGDNSITATISGNTLYLTAQELDPGEPDRTGIIILSYADLEASINVIQSSSVDKFLTLSLDDDFSPELGSHAGAFSEHIFVKASGPWTATLYGSTPPEFSLQQNGYTGELAGQTDSRFRVYTLDRNDTAEDKRAFVLVSLDEDPLNYVSVVSVSQKVAGSIFVNPSVEEIVFDGAGNLSYSSGCILEFESAGGHFLKWSAGTTFQYFDVSADFVTSDNKSKGKITISAKGENTTGGTFTEELVVQDDNGGEVKIKLHQTSLGLYITPSTVSATITAAGGASEWITVSTGSQQSTYSLDLIMVGQANNHEAYIERSDNRQGLSNIPIGTKFRMVFPKIYYPNRDKAVSATVLVSIDGSSLNGSISANQTKLTAKPVKADQMYYAYRGWITSSGTGGTYNVNYNRTIYNPALFGPAGVVTTPGTLTINKERWVANAAAIGADITMFNAQYLGESHSDATVARYIKTWLDTYEGILVINDDYHSAAAFNSGRLYNLLGHSYGEHGQTGSIHLYSGSDVVDRRAYIYVVGGKGPFGKVNDVSTVVARVHDNERQALKFGGYPSTAVPLMVDSKNSVSIMIDPGNRVAFNGELQVLHTENSNFNLTSGSLPNNDSTRFMANYVAFIFNTAMYGTHFSDMLVDTVNGSPNPIPAPWDPVWND